MKATLKAFAVLFALSSAPVYAQNYVIDVSGIVCQFCSLGVAKKVSKLPFIDQSKFDKGVKVDIHNQRVTIAVKNDLDQAALYTAIKDGGYHPIETYTVLADGSHEVYVP